MTALKADQPNENRLTILFFFSKALPLGRGMLPLRGVDPAQIMSRIHNHDLFFKIIVSQGGAIGKQ